MRRLLLLDVDDESSCAEREMVCEHLAHLVGPLEHRERPEFDRAVPDRCPAGQGVQAPLVVDEVLMRRRRMVGELREPDSRLVAGSGMADAPMIAWTIPTSSGACGTRWNDSSRCTWP